MSLSASWQDTQPIFVFEADHKLWLIPQSLVTKYTQNKQEQTMSSDHNFVQFVVDQIKPERNITYRKMFGEYALYSNGKVVALICDNQLYVKPTTAGKAFIGTVIEAPAYPGAKPSFLIEDQLEDREWISRLIELTEQELPIPRPKKKNKKIT